MKFHWDGHIDSDITDILEELLKQYADDHLSYGLDHPQNVIFRHNAELLQLVLFEMKKRNGEQFRRIV